MREVAPLLRRAPAGDGHDEVERDVAHPREPADPLVVLGRHLDVVGLADGAADLVEGDEQLEAGREADRAREKLELEQRAVPVVGAGAVLDEQLAHEQQQAEGEDGHAWLCQEENDQPWGGLRRVAGAKASSHGAEAALWGT